MSKWYWFKVTMKELLVNLFMKDLYEDMEWCANALNELYQALEEHDWDMEDDEEE